MSVGVYVVCARASSWITSSCSSYGSACSNDVKPSITVVRSVVQLAGAFDREQHVFLAAGLGEPEPLIAARLLVDLDHARAVRLHPAHLTARIVLAVDLGVHRRLLAAVEHVAGGVDAWAEQPPRFDHLGLFEDVERRRRRVVHRRDAVREVGRVFPLGLGQHFEPGIVEMRVRVDETRRNGRTAASMRVAPDGIVTLPDVPIAGDAVAGDDDVGAREDLVALHRDDAGACQCEDTARRRRVEARSRCGTTLMSGRAAPRPSCPARPSRPACRSRSPCLPCLPCSACSAFFALCASANAIASAIVRRWNVAPSVQVIARPWSAQAA